MLRYESIHLETLPRALPAQDYQLLSQPASNSLADLAVPRAEASSEKNVENKTLSANRGTLTRLAGALCDYITDTAYVALWLAPKTLFRASWPLTSVMLGFSALEGFTAWAVSWSGARLVDLLGGQGSSAVSNNVVISAGLLAVGATVLQSWIKNQLENLNSQLGIKTRARFNDDLANGVRNTNELNCQPEHKKLVDSSEIQSWVPVGLPRILSDLIGSTSVFSVMTLSIALQAPTSLRVIVLLMVAPKAVALAINTSRYAKDMFANQTENAFMRETKPALFNIEQASSLKRATLYEKLLSAFTDARNRVYRAESGRYSQMLGFNLLGDLVLGVGLWMTFKELFLSAPRPLGEKLFLFGVVYQVYKAAVSILDRVGGIKRAGVLLRMWSNFNGAVQVAESLPLSGKAVGFNLRDVTLRGIKTKKELSNIPNCEIAPGSVVFIIGDSDSGKSTMLQLFLGNTEAMQSGSMDVTIDGQRMSLADFAKRRLVDGVGILEQVHPQANQLPILEVLGFKDADDPMLKELLQLFNVDESVRERMTDTLDLKNWSSSQQGILFLIAALNKGDALILLDEPRLSADEVVPKILQARQMVARSRSAESHLPTMIVALGRAPELTEEVTGLLGDIEPILITLGRSAPPTCDDSQKNP
jgi:ABC-type phosphate/phosphonate transport system ATPase subunit